MNSNLSQKSFIHLKELQIVMSDLIRHLKFYMKIDLSMFKFKFKFNLNLKSNLNLELNQLKNQNLLLNIYII